MDSHAENDVLTGLKLQNQVNQSLVDAKILQPIKDGSHFRRIIAFMAAMTILKKKQHLQGRILRTLVDQIGEVKEEENAFYIAQMLRSLIDGVINSEALIAEIEVKKGNTELRHFRKVLYDDVFAILKN